MKTSTTARAARIIVTTTEALGPRSVDQLVTAYREADPSANGSTPNTAISGAIHALAAAGVVGIAQHDQNRLTIAPNDMICLRRRELQLRDFTTRELLEELQVRHG